MGLFNRVTEKVKEIATEEAIDVGKNVAIGVLGGLGAIAGMIFLTRGTENKKHKYDRHDRIEVNRTTYIFGYVDNDTIRDIVKGDD